MEILDPNIDPTAHGTAGKTSVPLRTVDPTTFRYPAMQPLYLPPVGRRLQWEQVSPTFYKAPVGWIDNNRTSPLWYRIEHLLGVWYATFQGYPVATGQPTLEKAQAECQKHLRVLLCDLI